MITLVSIRFSVLIRILIFYPRTYSRQISYYKCYFFSCLTSLTKYLLRLTFYDRSCSVALAIGIVLANVLIESNRMKIVFIIDCLKTKPIRFHRVEALYIFIPS